MIQFAFEVIRHSFDLFDPSTETELPLLFVGEIRWGSARAQCHVQPPLNIAQRRRETIVHLGTFFDHVFQIDRLLRLLKFPAGRGIFQHANDFDRRDVALGQIVDARDGLPSDVAKLGGHRWFGLCQTKRARIRVSGGR